MKTRRFLWWGSAVVLMAAFAIGGSYTWYSFARPCEMDAVQDASIFLVTQMKRFDDVYVSATDNPSQTAIIYPVAVLQQILVDTQQVAVPACMRTAKNELINYMQSVVRAFEAYSANKPDTTIKGFLDDSYAHIRNFRVELDAVNKCAPICWPF